MQPTRGFSRVASQNAENDLIIHFTEKYAQNDKKTPKNEKMTHLHPKHVFSRNASENAGNNVNFHFTACKRSKTLKTGKSTKNEKMTHLHPKRVFRRIASEKA